MPPRDAAGRPPEGEGQQHLSHLIGPGLAFVVLNVDSRIARPGRLENRVTRCGLRGLPKNSRHTFSRSAKRTLAGSRRICSRILAVAATANGVNIETETQWTNALPAMQACGARDSHGDGARKTGRRAPLVPLVSRFAQAGIESAADRSLLRQ
jgi:hypothetical protein